MVIYTLLLGGDDLYTQLTHDTQYTIYIKSPQNSRRIRHGEFADKELELLNWWAFMMKSASSSAHETWGWNGPG